jgi:capsular polysaccharide biosynthesis protein
MQNNQILALISRKIGGIILFGVFIGALSFFLLVVKEKNFKVGTDYLIVQNQTSSQDFYTLSKSAEYIGKILNEGIYSEIFIGEVAKTGKVNPEFLPYDKKEKLKQWSNTVQVGLNPDLGIISVQVFDNNQTTALAISQAIAEVLTAKSQLFYGEGQNINVKVLSGPVLEKNPSITNIAAVSIGGFALGVMLSALWIISKEDRRKKDMFARVAKPMASPNMAMNFPLQDEPQENSRLEENIMSDEDYLETIKAMGRK